MNYVNDMAWNANGQPIKIDYANSTRSTFSYDPSRKWLNTARVDKMNGELVLANHYLATYGYKSNGMVKDVALNNNNQSQDRSYEYDGLNRLTKVTAYQNPSSVFDTYDYNAIGNMISNSTHDPVNGYQYGSAAHAHAVTSVGNKTYGYDANGNMTSVNVSGVTTKSYTWDPLNRLITVANSNGTSSFWYDQDGNRIKKVGPNSGTTYYYGSMLELKGSATLVKYYYAGSMLVAKKEVTGTTATTNWYHGDHLQSTRLMTGADGNIANTYKYAAYGKTTDQTGFVPNERGYTGHATDEPDTGLIYMKARYYDPELGRFISADTIVQSPFGPQTLNRYSYVQNSPLNYADPSGHFSLKKFVNAVVAGVAGGAAFVLSGGNPVIAGMVAGAVSGALEGGGIGGIIQGAAIGGILGGVGGAVYSTFGNVGAYAMLGAGATYSTATGGLDGLAYFAGGVMGGMIGYAGATYAMEYNSGLAPREVGGPGGNCDRCMPEDMAPPGLKSERLSFQDLFEGNEEITSRYGYRLLRSGPDNHGGWDVAPRPQTGFGTKLLAPCNGKIIGKTSDGGGIYFRPSGFSRSEKIQFYHVALSPDLAGSSLPISVQKGMPIATLENTGRIEGGAHVHIQMESGGKIYNPKFIFK